MNVNAAKGLHADANWTVTVVQGFVLHGLTEIRIVEPDMGNYHVFKFHSKPTKEHYFV